MQREDALPIEAIVADIGGTNARFAVADLATLRLSHISQILPALPTRLLPLRSVPISPSFPRRSITPPSR